MNLITYGKNMRYNQYKYSYYLKGSVQNEEISKAYCLYFNWSPCLLLSALINHTSMGILFMEYITCLSSFNDYVFNQD